MFCFRKSPGEVAPEHVCSPARGCWRSTLGPAGAGFANTVSSGGVEGGLTPHVCFLFPPDISAFPQAVPFAEADSSR